MGQSWPSTFFKHIYFGQLCVKKNNFFFENLLLLVILRGERWKYKNTEKPKKTMSLKIELYSQALTIHFKKVDTDQYPYAVLCYIKTVELIAGAWLTSLKKGRLLYIYPLFRSLLYVNVFAIIWWDANPQTLPLNTRQYLALGTLPETEGCGLAYNLRFD